MKRIQKSANRRRKYRDCTGSGSKQHIPLKTQLSFTSFMTNSLEVKTHIAEPHHIHSQNESHSRHDEMNLARQLTRSKSPTAGGVRGWSGAGSSGCIGTAMLLSDTGSAVEWRFARSADDRSSEKESCNAWQKARHKTSLAQKLCRISPSELQTLDDAEMWNRHRNLHRHCLQDVYCTSKT